MQSFNVLRSIEGHMTMRQRKRAHNQRWQYLIQRDPWRGMDGWLFETHENPLDWLGNGKVYTDVDELMADLMRETE